MPKDKLSSLKRNDIQNFPLEEICNEFYKSSQVHPVLLAVFLESLEPKDEKNMESTLQEHGISAAMFSAAMYR
jgi:hypothetical protein